VPPHTDKIIKNLPQCFQKWREFSTKWYTFDLGFKKLRWKD